MGGGVSTGRITEVSGAFRSGKTCLSTTIAVTCQMPKSISGLGGTVLFLDTENTFSRAKTIRIAKRFGMDPNKVLADIFHARIYSTDHLVQMIHASEKAIKEKGARLIIVDSLTALMSGEYVGIGMIASRQQVLNSIIHELSRIAETYNVAVLHTNQVGVQMKGTFNSNGAIGRNIVAHGCHFRMQFSEKEFSAQQSLERKGIIVDAPDLPPNDCSFYITDKGISDDENPKDIAPADYKKFISDAKGKSKSKNEEEDLLDV